MAVTAAWYGKAIINAFGGETAGESISIDYLSDDIKVALMTSASTPSQDDQEFFADVLGCEVSESGTNYTQGGATLSDKTLGYTSGTHVAKFDAADVTWGTSTITARWAVIYKDSGNDATSPLLGYVDFGQDYSSSSGSFTITWAEGGIFTGTSATPA
jgi:hypothetical protein